MQSHSSGRNEMEPPLPLFCSECGAANTWQAPTCFACSEPLTHSGGELAAQPPVAFHHVPIVPPPVGDPGPGSLLQGRYRLLREIGQGGFGMVYLAEDGKRQNQRVAVKQMNIGKRNTREVIDATAAYHREVMLLSWLRHRCLPRIHDHFTDPEHWYLVMDYIEGQTLEAYMQTMPGKALPIREVIGIGIQVCEVLQYLHLQNPPIIFRDVKPANIMRTPRGRISLIDFGIARRFVAGQARDTGPLGSPGYAAPEQYGTNQTTEQTDIYALGATLQTLLTGKDPLELQAREAFLPSETRLHRKFFLLLDRMLEKESRKRPRSIREVRVRLEHLQRKNVLPFLLGLLLGCAAPYAFYAGLAVVFLSFPSFMLAVVFAVLWPSLLLAQLVIGLLRLFRPRTRFSGLGLLVGLALILLALIFHL